MGERGRERERERERERDKKRLIPLSRIKLMQLSRARTKMKTTLMKVENIYSSVITIMQIKEINDSHH